MGTKRKLENKGSFNCGIPTKDIEIKPLAEGTTQEKWALANISVTLEQLGWSGQDKTTNMVNIEIGGKKFNP